MQSRPIRRSGQPTCAGASSNAGFWPGPDPRRALWPAVTSTAQIGRTHGCTDQPADVKKSLANSEPSTHGTKRTNRDVLLFGRFWGRSGHQANQSERPTAKLSNCLQRVITCAGKDNWDHCGTSAPSASVSGSGRCRAPDRLADCEGPGCEGPGLSIAPRHHHRARPHRQPSWPSPATKNGGTSMGNALRSILIRLAAYLAVAIAAGLLFLAGATVYELMWPKPVVPFSQMSNSP